MAALAVGPVLSAVDVCMTIGARFSNVAEYRVRVALRTSDSLVHSLQRIASTIVIKLGKTSDRFPSAKRMAVLARDVQRAVWTPGVLHALRGGTILLILWQWRCHGEDQHRRSSD